MATQRRGGNKILAFLGSPRRGNTDRLLTEALEAASQEGIRSEKVVIRNLQISPCLEINQCMETGDCAIDDDMTPLYDKLTNCRAVILAAPIFFYGPSAQLKAVIDRCQVFWARKYVLNRGAGESRGRGYVISAAASGGDRLFEGFMMTARYFFDALDLEPSGELLVRGVDEAGDAAMREEALAEARGLGRRIAGEMMNR